jgi:hypothetical protein
MGGAVALARASLAPCAHPPAGRSGESAVETGCGRCAGLDGRRVQRGSSMREEGAGVSRVGVVVVAMVVEPWRW